MRHAGAMRASTLAGVAIAAGCLLLAFGPGLSDLPARPGLTLEWMRADPERALITATALAAWLLLAWLALGLLVCALTAVPGTAGAVAERLSRHVVPATVRRAAGLAVGASLATAPVLSAGTAFAVPAVPAPVVATPQPTSPAGQARGSDSGWPDLSRHPSAARAPANFAGCAARPDTAPPTTAPPTTAPPTISAPDRSAPDHSAPDDAFSSHAASPVNHGALRPGQRRDLPGPPRGLPVDHRGPIARARRRPGRHRGGVAPLVPRQPRRHRSRPEPAVPRAATHAPTRLATEPCLDARSAAPAADLARPSPRRRSP